MLNISFTFRFINIFLKKLLLVVQHMGLLANEYTRSLTKLPLQLKVLIDKAHKEIFAELLHSFQKENKI